ncbi:MAG TPA: hypothetical protein DCE56_23260 [Cyanobacteria bacterium UBA8553]|nr:hypothetical protein [Cyanobacteria bacterium UBA8553]
MTSIRIFPTYLSIKSPHYKTQSLDTSPEAEEYQFKLWRSRPLWKKAELVANWTKGTWELALVGISHQYPDASPAKIRREFIRRSLGVDISLPGNPFDEQRIMLSDPITLALDVANILNALNIPYLVGGSVASGILGEVRATQDIDLVADLPREKVNELIEILQPRFYVSEDAVLDAIDSQRSFNLIDNESLGKIDIFILKDEPFNQTEFQRRTPVVVRPPDQTLILPSAEDIILQKLSWYRQGGKVSSVQWRDVLGVMKLQGERLDFDYLVRWGEELKLTELLFQVLRESGIEF